MRTASWSSTEGLARYPNAPELHRALALLYTRENRPREALASIARASRLAPDDAGIAYVYALALHGAGRGPEAIALLERTLEHTPYHRDSLYALAMYRRDRGEAGAALAAARRLSELQPEDPAVQSLLSELTAASAR